MFKKVLLLFAVVISSSVVLNTEATASHGRSGLAGCAGRAVLERRPVRRVFHGVTSLRGGRAARSGCSGR